MKLVFGQESQDSFTTKDGKDIKFVYKDAELDNKFVIRVSKFSKSVRVNLIQYNLDWEDKDSSLFSIVKSESYKIDEFRNNWQQIANEFKECYQQICMDTF